MNRSVHCRQATATGTRSSWAAGAIRIEHLSRSPIAPRHTNHRNRRFIERKPHEPFTASVICDVECDGTNNR